MNSLANPIVRQTHKQLKALKRVNKPAGQQKSNTHEVLPNVNICLVGVKIGIFQLSCREGFE